MKHATIILMAAILAIACPKFVLAEPSTRPASAEPWPATAQRWEYGRFAIVLPDKGSPAFSWASPTNFFAAQSVQSLLDQLSHKVTMGKDPPVSILNALGEEGWDLCDHRVKEADGVRLEEFLLKRPAR